MPTAQELALQAAQDPLTLATLPAIGELLSRGLGEPEARLRIKERWALWRELEGALEGSEALRARRAALALGGIGGLMRLMPTDTRAHAWCALMLRQRARWAQAASILGAFDTPDDACASAMIFHSHASHGHPSAECPDHAPYWISLAHSPGASAPTRAAAFERSASSLIDTLVSRELSYVWEPAVEEVASAAKRQGFDAMSFTGFPTPIGGLRPHDAQHSKAWAAQLASWGARVEAASLRQVIDATAPAERSARRRALAL